MDDHVGHKVEVHGSAVSAATAEKLEHDKGAKKEAKAEKAKEKGEHQLRVRSVQAHRSDLPVAGAFGRAGPAGPPLNRRTRTTERPSRRDGCGRGRPRGAARAAGRARGATTPS